MIAENTAALLALWANGARSKGAGAIENYSTVISFQINTGDMMLMNRMDRIVLIHYYPVAAVLLDFAVETITELPIFQYIQIFIRFQNETLKIEVVTQNQFFLCERDWSGFDVVLSTIYMALNRSRIDNRQST